MIERSTAVVLAAAAVPEDEDGTFDAVAASGERLREAAYADQGAAGDAAADDDDHAGAKPSRDRQRATGMCGFYDDTSALARSALA